MAEISAGLVKELRERTGLPMMDCKRALTETGGDLDKAEELLRIKSGARASKAAGRTAATATSHFDWSSSAMISTGRPPMPPFSLMSFTAAVVVRSYQRP